MYKNTLRSWINGEFDATLPFYCSSEKLMGRMETFIYYIKITWYNFFKLIFGPLRLGWAMWAYPFLEKTDAEIISNSSVTPAYAQSSVWLVVHRWLKFWRLLSYTRVLEVQNELKWPRLNSKNAAQERKSSHFSSSSLWKAMAAPTSKWLFST